MTSSSSSSSYALSLFALFLFLASTPVHCQTINIPPIDTPNIILPPGLPVIDIPPIAAPSIPLLPGIPAINLPQLPTSNIPPINIPSVITNLTAIVNGQLCCTPTGNCPGQALSGVPVSINCLVNNVPTLVALTVTNNTGAFTLNATLSVTRIINTVTNLPTCFVTVPLSAVSAAQCAVLGTAGNALGTTGGVLLSIVRFVGPIVGRVLNAAVSLFIVI